MIDRAQDLAALGGSYGNTAVRSEAGIRVTEGGINMGGVCGWCTSFWTNEWYITHDGLCGFFVLGLRFCLNSCSN